MQLNGPLTEMRDGNVTVVVFSSDLKQLDELNVAEIGRRLIETVEKLPEPSLILDMTATEFFGSSFIETLFRVWKKLNVRPEAQFGIAGLQPYCREILEITHLNRLWPLFESREAGIEAFKKATVAG